MEPLDLLEKRVAVLLTEVRTLRTENRKLREDALASQHKVEEITKLQASLAQERKVREQALERVDAILKRIQEAEEAETPVMTGEEALPLISRENEDVPCNDSVSRDIPDTSENATAF